MPKGSEKFAWKLFPGAPRVCALCGKSLRVEDVMMHRTDFPSQKVRFYCTDHSMTEAIRTR